MDQNLAAPTPGTLPAHLHGIAGERANAVLGLSIPELVGYLCAPGRNLVEASRATCSKSSPPPRGTFTPTATESSTSGTSENLNAKLESYAKAYFASNRSKSSASDSPIFFRPVNGWCYQEVLALPAIDEINLTADSGPCRLRAGCRPGAQSHLRQFLDQTTFKNRVAFLTGSRNTFDNLLENAKRLKAIQQIIGEMEAEGFRKPIRSSNKPTNCSTACSGNFFPQ